MTAPRPCAVPGCGHSKRGHVHGRGCFAWVRALGHLVKWVPSGCKCPQYFDDRPLTDQVVAPPLVDDDDLPKRVHETYHGAYETRVA